MRLLAKMKLLTFISAILPVVIMLLSATDTLWKNSEFNQIAAVGVGSAFVLSFLLPSISIQWLAVGALEKIKRFCNQVKQGDYSLLSSLPNEDSCDEENEFISLMRDMNWMVHRIKLREKEMADLIHKLDLAKSNLLQQKQALETANTHLKEMAMTDALTGLSNRRHFFEHLQQELCRRQRYPEAISLFIIDIDFFKKINDNYGHQTGDLVIAEFATILKSSLRRSDLAARLGGEEFAVLLPDTSKEDALQVAYRIKGELAAYSFKDAQGRIVQATCSIGVYCDDSLPCYQEDLLYGYADQALYAAKNSGRNCIVCWDEKTGQGEKISA